MNHYQKNHCFYIDLQLHPPKLSRDLKNIAKNRRHLRMNSMVSHLSQSCCMLSRSNLHDSDVNGSKKSEFCFDWTKWHGIFVGGLHFLKDADACNKKIKISSSKSDESSTPQISERRRASSSSTPPSGLFRYLDVKVFTVEVKRQNFPLLRRTVKDLLLSSAQHPMASSVCQRTWRSELKTKRDLMSEKVDKEKHIKRCISTWSW